MRRFTLPTARTTIDVGMAAGGPRDRFRYDSSTMYMIAITSRLRQCPRFSASFSCLRGGYMTLPTPRGRGVGSAAGLLATAVAFAEVKVI